MMNGMNQEKELVPVDAKTQIQISKDRKTAHIVVSRPLNGGLTLTGEALERDIAAAGVLFGVDRQCVELLLGADIPYDSQQLLARAVLPEKGEDAVLEYHFVRSEELRPKVLPDGSVDFKDLGLIKNVRAGDVLCTKTPPGAGVPGRDVTGQELAPAPGRDVPLPAGIGTSVSEDGLRLLAAIDGQVDMANRRIGVMNTFTVKGDVGVATGNIDFVGNVQVEGNVTAGFQVKAAGNVIIRGMLDGGAVEAGGNVTIANGFNTGRTACEGELKCKYLQNAEVDAGGNVSTGSIVGSTVCSGDSIHVLGGKSQIFGSALTARNSIRCVNAGAPGISRPVTLEAGSDPGLARRRVENPKELAEAQKRAASIENLLKVFEAKKQLGRLNEDKLKEYETLVGLRQIMQRKISELELEREELEERAKSSGFGTIVVSGAVKEGTHIIIGTERLILKSDQTFVRFSRIAGQGIETGPAK